MAARARNGGGSGPPPLASPAPPAPRSSRWGLTLGFSLAGMAILLSSARGVLVTEIPLSAEWGLFQLLPALYWVGLGLMGLGVVVALRGSSQVLIVLTGLLFFAFLAGTPNLFEPFPRYWDAYQHLGAAQAIGLTGHLPTSPEEYSTNWPGFFVLIHVLNLMGDADPLALLTLFPFLAGALTFLALFVFLRSILPAPVVGLAAVLGALLSVWIQYHLSPQAVGLVMALLVLATAWQRNVGLRAVSAILFVGLVVTHPTSTILLVAIVGVDALLVYLRRYRRETPASEASRPFASSPALAFSAVWLAWLFFQARGTSQFAETTILTQMGRILQIPGETFDVTAATVEGVFQWAPLLRFGSLLIASVLAVLGLVLLARRREHRRLAQFFVAAVLGLTLLALADILSFEGFYDRALLLLALFVPAICLAGLAVHPRSRLVFRTVTALLVVASVAAASTIYYQEAFNLVSGRAAAVSEFLERAEPGSFFADGYYPLAVWIDPADRTPRGVIAFHVLYDTAFEDLRGENPFFALFDTTQALWYRQWFGLEIHTFYAQQRDGYSLLYTNGDAEVYLIVQPGVGAS